MTASACSGPSTLTYKQRLQLRKDSLYEYNKLYATSAGGDVYQRLSSDALARTTNSSARGSTNFSPQEGGAMLTGSKGQLSGFVSNTTPAAYSRTTFKTGLLATDDVPLQSLHPLSARKMFKERQIECRAAMRPETETTNQVLRMLGTYAEDHGHAQRLGIFIPASCPGGPGHYHPDVAQQRGGTLRRTDKSSYL